MSRDYGGLEREKDVYGGGGGGSCCSSSSSGRKVTRGRQQQSIIETARGPTLQTGQTRARTSSTALTATGPHGSIHPSMSLFPSCPQCGQGIDKLPVWAWSRARLRTPGARSLPQRPGHHPAAPERAVAGYYTLCRVPVLATAGSNPFVRASSTNRPFVQCHRPPAGRHPARRALTTPTMQERAPPATPKVPSPNIG